MVFPLRERVGHSFMKATMREHNSPFGGELAGHFYYRRNFTADSSIMTADRDAERDPRDGSVTL